MSSKGKAIGERNGIRIYTRLTAKKPLRSSTTLKIPKKQGLNKADFNQKYLNKVKGKKLYSTLKTRKPINKISVKQRERNKQWNETTDNKCVATGFICQWCGKPGKRDGNINSLTGHHIIKRRYRIDTRENCYIAHWQPCHDFIEIHSIDVRVYPNKEAYDNRQI